MNSLVLPRPRFIEETEAQQAQPLVQPGELWAAALAATLIPLGLIWDFSWESTIGVDRFWSPPHLMTYLGAWLSGALALRLVFVFTRARQRGSPAAGVTIGPCSAPSGAWVLLWSAGTLQVVLLLDSWWQQAYGLGAGLWPPPQILKAGTYLALLTGNVMLAEAASSSQASSRGAMRTVAPYLSAWQGGLWLTLCALFLITLSYPNQQHTATFCLISCAVYPTVLLAGRRGVGARPTATGAALVYMGLGCAMVWLLPLFSARPLTPPIQNPTDHMMPPPFPLLLVVPALLLDLLDRGRPEQLGRVPHSIAAGFLFVGAFESAQWFFSKFLLSAGADNWLFAGGGRHWPYFLKIDQARFLFWGVKQDPLTWKTIFIAGLLASASAWVGLRVASWLSNLER